MNTHQITRQANILFTVLFTVYAIGLIMVIVFANIHNLL